MNIYELYGRAQEELSQKDEALQQTIAVLKGVCDGSVDASRLSFHDKGFTLKPVGHQNGHVPQEAA